jgi:hypothetical protein
VSQEGRTRRFRHVVRGGRYVRVADPSWRRPLDPSFAAERGGRWNPPDSFPVVYLCADRDVARAVVAVRFGGLPYGILDLLPDRLPVLVESDVAEHRALDVVTDAGCQAVGLPRTYPRDSRRRTIPWRRTQPIGENAWSAGERSIACRSAALPVGEELAWFVRTRADRLRVAARQPFDSWF